MKLVSAKCPNCGADIEVDKNSDKTKCEYCNSKIIVEDAIEKYKIELSGEVTVKNLPQVDSLMKVADRAYEINDIKEALEKYDKIVDIDPDNHKAVFRKAICKYSLTPPINSKLIIISDILPIIGKIVNNDNTIMDNYYAEILTVLDNKAGNLDQFAFTNQLDYNQLNTFDNVLYEIIDFLDTIYNNVSNEKLKLNYSNIIVKHCANYMKKRTYYLNGSIKKYIYQNIPSVSNIYRNHSKIINPQFSEENEKKRTEKQIKEWIIIIGILLGVAVSLIVVLVENNNKSFIGNTYVYKSRKIFFPSNEYDDDLRKLYITEKSSPNAGSTKNSYIYTFIKDKNNNYKIVVATNSGNEIYFYYNDSDSLCLFIDDKCSEVYKRQ